MSNAARLARRVDAFCAHLNGGLAAVALVLALLTGAALLQRVPASVLQLDAQTGDLLNEF